MNTELKAAGDSVLDLYGIDPSELIRQRQADFEHEVGLNSASYAPLSDEQLGDLVYQDYLEDRATRKVSHAG